MKTYGAIDIGTNSVLLLIGRIDKNKHIEPIHEDLKVTRIGKGVYDTKLIKNEAMTKTLSVLKDYIDKCKKSGAENIKVVGTSALRMAENSSAFLNLVKNETDIIVEVISGKKEAELSFLGAVSGIEDKGINTTIIDIGGGSTEIIFGADDKIQYSKSLEIGSVRLTEKFLKSDPVEENEVRNIREAIKNNLKQIPPRPPLAKGGWGDLPNKDNLLIGVAGTVTTLAQIDLKIPGYDRLKIGNWKLKSENLKRIISVLKKKDMDERKKIIGLEPDRADVIIAGAIILEEIINYLKFYELHVSTRGLRYGVMMEMI